METLKEYKKYLPVVAFLILAYAAYLVVKPFIVPIISAALLAYIFFPWYKFFKGKLRNDTVSALITTAIVLVVVTVPLGFLINQTAHQVYDVAKTASLNCEDQNVVCDLVRNINNYVQQPVIKAFLDENIKKQTTSIIGLTSNIIFSIPGLLASLFIIIFVIYYAFKTGQGVFEWIRKHALPFNDAQTNKLMRRCREITEAVVYGYIVVAFIVAIVGATGFYVFGVARPLFWGMLLFVVSLFPVIGPTIIWIPLGLYNLFLFYTGQIPWWQGIGILLVCGPLISAIDNFMKAKITGDKGSVHPVIVLVGALGGIKLLGFIGLLVGPLILALTIAIIDVVETS